MVIHVELKLPMINSLKGKWTVNDLQRQASWEMYIQVITRISSLPLERSQRNAEQEFSDLNDLLEAMRGVLGKYGPSSGEKGGDGELSFAYITLVLINVLIRPVLALKGKSCTVDLYQEFDRTYAVLIDYCGILVQAAEVEL